MVLSLTDEHHILGRKEIGPKSGAGVRSLGAGGFINAVSVCLIEWVLRSYGRRWFEHRSMLHWRSGSASLTAMTFSSRPMTYARNHAKLYPIFANTCILLE